MRFQGRLHWAKLNSERSENISKQTGKKLQCPQVLDNFSFTPPNILYETLEDAQNFLIVEQSFLLKMRLDNPIFALNILKKSNITPSRYTPKTLG